jgi:type IV pilus biogenesis protein CpaD/CtpE
MRFRIVRIVLAAVAAATLAGCASDPRRAEGLQWVVEQQQERDRLEAQGFPQYSYD